MMKIQEIKQYVYKFAGCLSTKELKKKHPELTQDKDLRKKVSWLSIYQFFKATFETIIEPATEVNIDNFADSMTNLAEKCRQFEQNISRVEMEFCVES